MQCKIIIMDTKLITYLVTVSILSAILSAIIYANSYNVALGDEDFCYDQVGDGQHCFEALQKCKNQQRHDDIAESPCYRD